MSTSDKSLKQKGYKVQILKLLERLQMLIGTYCDLQKFLISAKINFHLKTSLDDPFLHVFHAGIMPQIYTELHQKFQQLHQVHSALKEDPFLPCLSLPTK